MTTSPNDISRLLARFGFYFSLILFFYGILFPFHFDFSPNELSKAWSQAGLLPYWDVARGRIHSFPDTVANIMLLLPAGFFGFLHRAHRGKAGNVWNWLVLGLALGFMAEILQLGIPSRSSGITDVINDGVGAWLGAAAARGIGQHALEFLTGAVVNRQSTYLWILIGVLAVGMLGPFDFSLDVSHFRSDAKKFIADPWESGKPIGDECLQMTGFALTGALAGKILRERRRVRPIRTLKAAIIVVLFLPVTFEFAQLLVESHAPSLRDLSMDMVGASLGFMVGVFVPAATRPGIGFLILALGLVAAGLSPYHFAGGQGHSSFEWIPFNEYFSVTTMSALYDAVMGLLNFGLLGGLLKLSCRRCPGSFIVGCAMALAAGIELAQVFLPARYAGVTDILIAGLGAWAGTLICTAIESSRGFGVEIKN